MSIMQLPPALYQKLLIVDHPDKENRHVSFSDMNPVKTYRVEDPPNAVSEVPELVRLRAQVRRLENKLKNFEEASVMTRIQSQPTTPSYGDRSVNSPTPQTASPRSIPANDWTHGNTINPHPPANVRAAQQARPTATVAAPPAPAAIQPNPPTRAAIPARKVEPKPSVFKRILLGAGALFIMASAPLILAIVPLGPLGLLVPVVSVAIGVALLSIGNRVK